MRNCRAFKLSFELCDAILTLGAMALGMIRESNREPNRELYGCRSLQVFNATFNMEKEKNYNYCWESRN